MTAVLVAIGGFVVGSLIAWYAHFGDRTYAWIKRRRG